MRRSAVTTLDEIAAFIIFKRLLYWGGKLDQIIKIDVFYTPVEDV